MGQTVKGYDRVLFSEAVEACKRCERAAESDDLGVSQAGPAAAAIVLAEASLEAFVSEALAILEWAGTITSEARDYIGDKRCSFWRNCSRLYEELSGEPLERKRVYHDRLLPLVKLRHCVVHRSADLRAIGAWPKQIAPYRKKIDHVEGGELHWTSQLLTFRTAWWAATAAYVTRDELHRVLPRGSDAEKLHRAFTTWTLDSTPPDVS